MERKEKKSYDAEFYKKIKILFILIFIVSWIPLIFGIYYTIAYGSAFEEHEVLNKTGTCEDNNATHSVESGHVYRITIYIEAEGDHHIEATVKIYIDNKFETEVDLFGSATDDEDDEEGAYTRKTVEITPEKDAELLIKIKECTLDSWEVWIYKDLPVNIIIGYYIGDVLAVVGLIGVFIAFFGVLIYHLKQKESLDVKNTD